MSNNSLRLVPTPAAISAPMPAFDPKIHHVTQEEALEATMVLADKRFNIMGSIEQYSGVHPTLGRVIILITSSSDSVIIPVQ
ncbi:hypothetical protein [Methylobacterium sp. AMS5]|uniref:hypothetical protein n=1 Tax=Methylobacterium sp. AMS5 TaxID=925818 RepID=UPI00074FA543|nr:hypothetical protein [Methylobacterium sp. AMS5]AMB48383.1 hypothetical protein Y590_25780 [Methylobacterium sp. AMS5]